MEKELADFVQKLRDAAGENLKSVILFGSSVTGEFQAKHSHLDILCVIERADVPQIEALHPAIEWWLEKGNPEPRVFTADELRRSADVFAIELLDIKERHRVLFGEDAITNISVPLRYHKIQVERELRTNSLRLRQTLLVAPKKPKVKLGIIVSSVSTFVALFRHALIALGEPPAANKRDAVDRIAKISGGSPSGFHAVLDFREGKRKENELEVAGTLQSYVDLVEKVTNEVDRRLDVNP
jgi:predicted nucleotidyltransferase